MAQPGPATKSNAVQFFKRRLIKTVRLFFFFFAMYSPQQIRVMSCFRFLLF